MPKNLLFLIVLVALMGCKNREAAIPAYVTINDFKINTDYSSEGTASTNVTTVWVTANDEELGAFELPVTLPVITDGETKIIVEPGINLNGQQLIRNIYEFYTPFTKSYSLGPGDELTLNTQGGSSIVTKYEDDATIIKVEDFEGAGINFVPTAKSDTILARTSDPDEIFSQEGLNEPNTKSGKVVMRKGNSLVEFESINAFELPKFNSNVYLEVNYKCDVNVVFGVFANEPLQRIQSPVVTVLPTDEWKKIYINLVTDVSGYPNAIDFNLFFGAINTDANSNPTILIDNMKLVY